MILRITGMKGHASHRRGPASWIFAAAGAEDPENGIPWVLTAWGRFATCPGRSYLTTTNRLTSVPASLSIPSRMK